MKLTTTNGARNKLSLCERWYIDPHHKIQLEEKKKISTMMNFQTYRRRSYPIHHTSLHMTKDFYSY